MHNIQYKVVVNHEEQYALWPDRKENASGWVDCGISGTKEECLAYIRRVWTDLRPLSLRSSVAQAPTAHVTDRPQLHLEESAV